MNPSKNKILEAASKLFSKGGISALSVRAIANEAGLSTIGIYSHFKGKQGILDALYIEGFEQVVAATTIEADVSPREAIMLATQGYLENAEKHEGHYRLIFGENDASYTPSPEANEVGAAAFIHISRLISGILPESASRAKKQEISLQLWALVHGYVSLRHHAITDFIDSKDWQALALKAVELHLDALLKA